MDKEIIQRERVLPHDAVYPRLFDESLARYKLAARYVRGKKVLDIACGTGYGSYYLATHGAYSVVAGDFSDEAIASCKKAYRHDTLSFEIMDATHLHCNDATFDVVCSFETIEHIVEPEKYMNELKRVLKKGGTLIISTPNKRLVSAGSVTPRNPYHVREYTADEFKNVLLQYFHAIELFGHGVRLRSKILLKGINSLPQLFRNSSLLRRMTSDVIVIDKNIFTKEDIGRQSLHFIGICKNV